jgi:iron-only hydrogenase group A
MEIKLEVNNKIITAMKGETILSALQRNGITVPTICNMKEFTPTGACRMCVVEVDGKEKLIPSCSHPVEEWMRIKTHSHRVISARRTIIELLLANHPDDCLYCERNGDCELQTLAEDFHIRERRLTGRKNQFKIDKSSPGIVRDPSKCILCGRCVRICEEKQSVATFDFAYRGMNTKIATTFEKPIDQSNCINCGQCVAYCPTGALTENVNLLELENMLHHPNKELVIQYSVAVASSINEEFGFKSGRYSGGFLNAAFKKIGFNHVIDTTLGADLVTEKLAELIVHRIKKNENLPVMSSCCPSWVLYVENNHPELIPNLSGIKSPQVLSSIIQKKHIAARKSIKEEDVFTVSVMPCTAKKSESKRLDINVNGNPAVDMVITTRELFRLIRMNGIDMENIDPEPIEAPFDKSSGASKMISISGGTTEGLIRSVFQKINKQVFEEKKVSVLRNSKPLKEYTVKLGNEEYVFAVINGFRDIEKNLADLKERKNLVFVEVMACMGGCVGGGGQPKIDNADQLKSRSKPLYDMDERDIIKASYKNPNVKLAIKEILKSDPAIFKAVYTARDLENEL